MTAAHQVRENLRRSLAMFQPLALFVALVALALAATGAAALVPAAPASVGAWALLAVVPLSAGALGSLLVQPRRRMKLRPEVRMPGPSHLPLVLVLLGVDLAALGLGRAMGWLDFAPRPGLSPAFALATLAFGLPFALFVGVHGWEWGLRARLYGPWSRRRSSRGALLATLGAGALLSLCWLAPGFEMGRRPALWAALAATVAREATALRLFQRSGVLLSGSYRGALLGFEALLVADASVGGEPLASYAVADPRFFALRALLPWAGLVVASIWCARLDRRDAERRRNP